MSTRIFVKGFVFWCLMLMLAVPTAGQRSKVINWMTLEEAQERSKIEQRKIIVEMYASWCKHCAQMDSITFKNEKVIRYLNEKFYAVRLDGEHKGDIEFKGETYSFKKASRSFFSKTENKAYHELAAKLTDGNISYPTIIFLDEQFNTIQSIQGFKDPHTFMAFLSYIGQGYQKKMPWSQFYNSYQRNQE